MRRCEVTVYSVPSPGSPLDVLEPTIRGVELDGMLVRVHDVSPVRSPPWHLLQVSICVRVRHSDFTSCPHARVSAKMLSSTGFSAQPTYREGMTSRIFAVIDIKLCRVNAGPVLAGKR